MAVMLRRRLPLVLGPLVLGLGFHSARQRLIANEGSASTLLNPAQVSARLRAHEESVLVDRGNGVLRYDVAQLASNDPVEDDHSERIVQVPLVTPQDVGYYSDWHFWGIYDGHAGFSTSAKLHESLIPYVVSELNNIFPPVAPGNPQRLAPIQNETPTTATVPNSVSNGRNIEKSDNTPESGDDMTNSSVSGDENTARASVISGISSDKRSSFKDARDPDVINQALVRAFVRLDNEIVNSNVESLLRHPSREQAISKLPAALSGSCALLAFYDSASRDLRLALAGDSRAVLGVKSTSGHWQARTLTSDQTGSNEDEVHRIRSEHPQSEKLTAVRRGRVLGIYEPTRSFGDAVVKWPREIQRRVADLFFSSRVPSNLLTPPYLTAEPVITKIHLEPDESPCFLVLASDGLFEMLSSDQVVGLVVDWLQTHKSSYLQTFDATHSQLSGGSSLKENGTLARLARLGSALFRSQPAKRTLGDPVEDISDHKETLKPPISRQQMNSPPLRVASQDENVATHLMRNALGGDDHEQVSLLLSIPTPMSRNYRDDLTVTVVFFGNPSDPPTGGLVTNEGATHLRAKL